MEKFYSYFNSSETVSPEASDYFSSIIEKYPYFQVARVLYLKNLKVSNTQVFEEKLLRNAALLPDRRQLFFYLNPMVTSAPSEAKLSARAVSRNESEASFVLIDDFQSTNGSLKDITDPPKESGLPVSEFELLEINDSEGNNDRLISSGIGEYSMAESGNDSDKPTNDDLIEQFIKTSPRLKPPLKVPDEQEDISLKSLEEPEDLITEPIAKIYLSQGLTDKAISIYEKLSLKYPEKSSYFASQIQEIKQHFNK